MKNETVNQLIVHKGIVSVGHRPGKVRMKYLCGHHYTHVLTIQGKQESPNIIRKVLIRNGIQWLHLPIGSAKRDVLFQFLPEIRDMTQKVMPILTKPETKLYIHCAAGIHRTGMITYVLLRSCGYSVSETIYALISLREDTFGQIGQHRLGWAEQAFGML
ncbi:tyrosine-protein phosphatase [Planctomycetota bacterium]